MVQITRNGRKSSVFTYSLILRHYHTAVQLAGWSWLCPPSHLCCTGGKIHRNTDFNWYWNQCYKCGRPRYVRMSFVRCRSKPSRPERSARIFVACYPSQRRAEDRVVALCQEPIEYGNCLALVRHGLRHVSTLYCLSGKVRVYGSASARHELISIELWEASRCSGNGFSQVAGWNRYMISCRVGACSVTRTS